MRRIAVLTSGGDAAGMNGGAEVIVIPEVETNPEEVAAELRGAYERSVVSPNLKIVL